MRRRARALASASRSIVHAEDLRRLGREALGALRSRRRCAVAHPLDGVADRHRQNRGAVAERRSHHPIDGLGTDQRARRVVDGHVGRHRPGSAASPAAMESWRSAPPTTAPPASESNSASSSPECAAKRSRSGPRDHGTTRSTPPPPPAPPARGPAGPGPPAARRPWAIAAEALAAPGREHEGCNAHGEESSRPRRPGSGSRAGIPEVVTVPPRVPEEVLPTCGFDRSCAAAALCPRRGLRLPALADDLGSPTRSPPGPGPDRPADGAADGRRPGAAPTPTPWACRSRRGHRPRPREQPGRPGPALQSAHRGRGLSIAWGAYDPIWESELGYASAPIPRTASA